MKQSGSFDHQLEELLTTEEAAKFLKVSKSFLMKSRLRGDGPVYIKLGSRSVRYRDSDLSTYLKLRARSSTAE